MRMIQMMFRYDHRNHCWPAIRKSIIAISIYTLLLSVIETFIVYEINKAFEVSEGDDMIAPIVLGILNSIILRKYICIISLHNSGNPRFGCHSLIWLFSWIFITIGATIEHDARMEVYQSNTLDEISFKKGDEYYHIDQVGTLDTINGEKYIVYEELHLTHQSPKHSFRGYYVVPFTNRKSVFYTIKFMREYPTNRYTEKESRKMFNQAFQDSVSRINPIVGNHLFQRILPQARDYDNYCINASFSSFSQKYDYAGIEAIFSPAENDRKPRWYDELLKYASCIVLYILVLIFGFGTCKTEDC